MSAVLETTERLNSFIMPPFPVRRFTVAEYRAMVESGVLEQDDRIELLEGWIVPKVTHDPPHDWTVTQILGAMSSHLPDEWLIRVQCAINTQDSEPEPDLAIVHGPNDRYLQRHPRGADIGLLIEVSATSLAKDRRKAAIYAAEGIPAYWIINLTDRQIEVFTQPDETKRNYRGQQILAAETLIDFELDGESIGSFPVDELLPPPT